MRELTATLPFDNPDGGVWKQGWNVDPIPIGNGLKELEIIVVPHSHCDPGWIKTFDEYFQSQTKHILDSVIDGLLKDKRRTFIWAEISYFSWWWKDQTPERQSQVRQLLLNKQFEFVTGGWVMPDEANSNWFALETQLQEGHDWIEREFGVDAIPKHGWSIDPFGYSSTMPYLLKKFGFEGMLIQRVHYAVKKYLASHQHLEFVWRQTWDDDGGTHDIHTHVMPFYSYDVPHTCGPDPAICCQFDFRRSPVDPSGPACPWRKSHPVEINEHNVEQRSLLLLDQYRKKANLYQASRVLLIPIGDDFRYESPREVSLQFGNHQRIHDWINQNVDGVSIRFGTLSEYFEKTRTRFHPPVLKGSFFTYSDVDEDYWSGYYTSRVFDKALDRRLERTLFAAEQLAKVVTQDQDAMEVVKAELQSERRALSLFQHHDGVTGTAKDHVVRDYAQRMYNAMTSTHSWMAKRIMEHYYNKVVPNHNQKPAAVQALQPCFQANEPRNLPVNRCNHQVVVLAWNPLDTIAQVCGETVVEPNAVQMVTLPCEVGYGQKPKTKVEAEEKMNPRITAATNRAAQIADLLLEFDPHTGLLTKPIREEWKFWRVHRGGAYLFFPDQQDTYSVYQTTTTEDDFGYTVETPNWKRTLVVTQDVNADDDDDDDFSNATTIVLDFVYETDINQMNQEWFVRFHHADIKNERLLYTDLNGFNFDTHVFRPDLPIQSQVFPMPTLACIQDKKKTATAATTTMKKRMTVLSEHAQGTASLEEGSIDVFLDRRLGQDDAKGLGQGVTDNRPTVTRLRVVLEPRPATRVVPQEEEFSTTTMVDSSNFDNGAAAAEKFLEQEEFEITPLTRRMYEQLQHPLELFGPAADETDEAATTLTQRRRTAQHHKPNNRIFQSFFNFFKEQTTAAAGIIDDDEVRREIHQTIVPLVYRIDYTTSLLDLQRSMESLLSSDFPRFRVPLVLSIDGNHLSYDLLSYLEYRVLPYVGKAVRLIHDNSCYDEKIPAAADNNIDHEACRRRHFTWLANTVLGDDFQSQLQDSMLADDDDGNTEALDQKLDSFVFLEASHVVSPVVYAGIVAGSKLVEQHAAVRYPGVTLGICLGTTDVVRNSLQWTAQTFDSEACTAFSMHRGHWKKLREKAATTEYCQTNDAHWQGPLVQLMASGQFPHVVLVPPQRLAAAQHQYLTNGEKHHGSQLPELAGLAVSNRLTLPAQIGRPRRTSAAAASSSDGWTKHVDYVKQCFELLKGSAPPEGLEQNLKRQITQEERSSSKRTTMEEMMRLGQQQREQRQQQPQKAHRHHQQPPPVQNQQQPRHYQQQQVHHEQPQQHIYHHQEQHEQQQPPKVPPAAQKEYGLIQELQRQQQRQQQELAVGGGGAGGYRQRKITYPDGHSEIVNEPVSQHQMQHQEEEMEHAAEEHHREQHRFTPPQLHQENAPQVGKAREQHGGLKAEVERERLLKKQQREEELFHHQQPNLREQNRAQEANRQFKHELALEQDRVEAQSRQRNEQQPHHVTAHDQHLSPQLQEQLRRPEENVKHLQQEHPPDLDRMEHERLMAEAERRHMKHVQEQQRAKQQQQLEQASPGNMQQAAVDNNVSEERMRLEQAQQQIEHLKQLQREREERRRQEEAQEEEERKRMEQAQKQIEHLKQLRSQHKAQRIKESHQHAQQQHVQEVQQKGGGRTHLTQSWNQPEAHRVETAQHAKEQQADHQHAVGQSDQDGHLQGQRNKEKRVEETAKHAQQEKPHAGKQLDAKPSQAEQHARQQVQHVHEVQQQEQQKKKAAENKSANSQQKR